MTLMVFGKTGQVARELHRLRPDAQFLDRAVVDLRDADGCILAIQQSDAEAVINAAAYTDVDGAEQDEETAYLVNAVAPGAMAKAAAAKGVPFLHVSTDYVFSGEGRSPSGVQDPTAPLGAYGRTKLAGENAIRAAGGTFIILRTSWVFSAHGRNFVKTMLRLSETRDTVSVVADQVGGPTPANAIAAALLEATQCLKEDFNRAGIYHFAGAPDVSWADFAREIFARAGRDATVVDIQTAAYPTPAKRPINSRLDCSDMTRVFGISRPDWRQHLEIVVKELSREP